MGTELPSLEKPPPMAATSPEQASVRQIIALGVGLIFLCALLIYLFVSLWPGDLAKKHGDDLSVVTWFGTCCGVSTTVDARLLLLVMVTGGLGSFIHTATSFADFVGNQKLSTNWIWWYIMRPFIGMSLAAIFYLAVRAGFLTGGGQPETINLFGVAALTGMVGMFSKQATDKLSEVFDTLFKTAPNGGDVQREGGLASPVPVLRLVEPAILAAAATSTVVWVRGSGFTSSSVVRVADSDRQTVFENSGSLSFTLLPLDLSTAGRLDISVITPPPGGGRSSTMSLVIGDPPPGASGASSAAPAVDADAVDGCDVSVVKPTADEALPPARGGVG